MRIIETHSAPNPRRVRIFLAEKGIVVPFEEVDLMAGALRTDAMSAKNPLQRVPILEFDDGTCLAETVAICRYFDELTPEPPLFGSGALGKATVEMWQRRMELGLLASVAAAFRHLHPKMAHLEVPQVPAWGEANKPRALEMLSLMDRHLATSRFLTGPGYSIADITALVALDFMKPARIARPEGLAHLDRWYNEVSSRPSAQA